MTSPNPGSLTAAEHLKRCELALMSANEQEDPAGAQMLAQLAAAHATAGILRWVLYGLGDAK
jgi:hypothetical protein